MKITVLYNTNTSSANDPLLKIADEDTIKTAIAVHSALAFLGHNVCLFDITEKSFSELLYIDTDFYFNISEGIGSIPKSFVDVARELEKIDIPFSGSSSYALALTTEKAKVKELLTKKGISTADFFLFDGDLSKHTKLSFPLVVKPSTEDCSIGIDHSSVVWNQIELKSKLAKLWNDYEDPLLVEKYLDGREFAVTVIGNGRSARTLPIYEIIYSDYFRDKPKIYDYRAKWDTSSKEYASISINCPADINDILKNRIEEIALSAFQATKCSDYARVDMRLATSGEPYVLEINANPGVGPDDETVSSAYAFGINYEKFISTLVKTTLKRFYRKSYDQYLPLFNSV